MKIKLNKKTGYFLIKRLNPRHLEAIRALVYHCRLGEGYYEDAAFELAEMFDNTSFENVNYGDCTLDVEMDEDTPIINLSHVND